MKNFELTPELAAVFDKLVRGSTAFVVEGKKDKAALGKIGVSGSRIFVLNKKPIFAVAEEVAEVYRAAVILTDLDEEGKKLYGRLNTLLQRLGVRVDDRLRNFLFKNTKLRQIEGIGKLM